MKINKLVIIAPKNFTINLSFALNPSKIITSSCCNRLQVYMQWRKTNPFYVKKSYKLLRCETFSSFLLNSARWKSYKILGCFTQCRRLDKKIVISTYFYIHTLELVLYWFYVQTFPLPSSLHFAGSFS